MKRSKPDTVAQRRTLRIGIVGAGQMARQHARAIGRLTDAAVTAVVDPDPAALNEILQIQPSARTYATLENMLASQTVDAVHICTPPSTHDVLTEQVLAVGCHVYVEKPFAETLAAATRLARLADRKGVKICAGHQLLYESPTIRARELLPALGELTHIESYFSFRAAKHLPTGRAPLRDDLQLLDILPHPVYLLLDFLDKGAEGSTHLMSVQIGPKGTVHAFVKRGSLTATLVVTLEGRPVESFVRLVGTNGSVHADYVRSTVQRNLGPGASGIDKLLSPYSLSRQLLVGTTSSLGKRFLKRQRSYPGLTEIFAAFYDSIRDNGPSPVSRSNLLETVSICEQIGESLRTAYLPMQPAATARSAPIVITGGTGILGKEVARALVALGEQVRVVARRTPPDWDKLPGVSYVVADISQPIRADVMADAHTIIHCAAETAGRWDQHQRNSVNGTEEVMRAAGQAKVKRMIHISSISVLAVPRRGESLTDDGPIEARSRSGGPNAWGKIESERIAAARCAELGIDLRIVRPSAVIDYRRFDPPGLLGRRVGNIFVAVGMPGHKLGVVDVVFSAQTIAWITRHFESAPKLVNLFEPELPTKRELLVRLRRENPDLRIVWLVPVVLVPLSWLGIAVQKIIRPRKAALNVSQVFARLRYDTSLIRSLAPLVRAEFASTGQTSDFVVRPPRDQKEFSGEAKAALQAN